MERWRMNWFVGFFNWNWNWRGRLAVKFFFGVEKFEKWIGV